MTQKEIKSIQSFLELEIEQSAINSLRDNPMQGTPFEGLIIQHAITATSVALKEATNEQNLYNETTRRILNSFIDTTTERIIKKYLIF
jgi:hypothetical protein